MANTKNSSSYVKNVASHLHAGKVNAIIVTNGILLWKLKSDSKKTPNFRAGFAGSISKATSLSAIKGKKHSLVSTHIGEFDRVLSGGIVKSSVTLVGGDPGIGKSSILLQIMSFLFLQKKVLYISGEESFEQIALRAERLNLAKDNLYW